MEQHKNSKDSFEEALSEILSSGPDNRNTRHQSPPELHSPNSSFNAPKPPPQVRDLIFRIIAAISAIGLLLLFGLQTAQR